MPEPARQRHPYRLARTVGRGRHATVFSRDEILDAIRDWARIFGDPPTTSDWDIARAHRRGELWRIERRGDGDWPTARMVRNQFGSLTTAIRAAGIQAPSPRKPRRRQMGREEIVAAVRRWNALHGEPPSHADWEPSRARRQGHMWKVTRYYAGDWPSAYAVRKQFGTFAAAIEAAGLKPRPRGAQSNAPNLNMSDKLALRRTLEHSHPAAERQRLATMLGAVMRAEQDQHTERLREGLVELAVSALRWAEGLAVAATSTAEDPR